VSVAPVSVTVISGDNEEVGIPNIRIVGTDDQQRGPNEATESSATTSEGISLSLTKFSSSLLSTYARLPPLFFP